MDQRQESIQTILQLFRQVEPRHQDHSDAEVKQAIVDGLRVDVDEADEDKLDILMEQLARRKKNRPQTNKAAPVPIRGTPPLLTKELVAETDFLVNERVKHNKCHDWGEGDILEVHLFQVHPHVYQKLIIMFNKVGKKTLIVQPGMLSRLPAPKTVSQQTTLPAKV